MMWPGLQLAEFQFPQPFADSALRNGDREASGHFRAQIDAAPTDHFVDFAIRPVAMPLRWHSNGCAAGTFASYAQSRKV
jgi:hypothetical protein